MVLRFIPPASPRRRDRPPVARDGGGPIRRSKPPIDAELVACSAAGVPGFRKLHASAATSDELCLWAFDLLHLNGKDLLELPLVKRRAKLQALIERHDHPTILFSSAFDDPHHLLAACEERRMEGIVSKRVDAPYRSSNASDWIKVKCAGWREANKERWRLFEKSHA